MDIVVVSAELVVEIEVITVFSFGGGALLQNNEDRSTSNGDNGPPVYRCRSVLMSSAMREQKPFRRKRDNKNGPRVWNGIGTG